MCVAMQYGIERHVRGARQGMLGALLVDGRPHRRFTNVW